MDTQLSRLGGPNFHELPINAPLAPIHNNQRDGMHRQAIHHGRAAYEPNSLAGGCPFQAGSAGFIPFPEPVSDVELRGKPEKFAEHYNQASLFFESQAEHEKRHITDAFSFELSKVTVPGIRRRMVALLRNVSEDLARSVARNLGMPDLPDALPKANAHEVKPELTRSEFLSLMARPGEGEIRTRKIAVLVADGVNARTVGQVAKALMANGAVVRLVGQHVGLLPTDSDTPLDADASSQNSPSALFDAVVIPDGDACVDALCKDGLALEYVRDQFRHGKSMLAIGAGVRLIERAGIPIDPADKGLIIAETAGKEGISAFILAVAQHRHPERETDPPAV